MPSETAARVSEPHSSIASSNAIFPGPSEQPGARSMRKRTRSIRRDSLAELYTRESALIATVSSMRTIRIVSGIAALAWLAAWFLPVAKELPGWLAFRYALEPLWNPQSTQPEDAVPFVLSALTNVVFPVLFVLAYRDAITRPGLYIRVAIACFLLNLYWVV